MKITLVHYTFGGTIGGVEFVMEQHARLFARHGHEVSVICERGASDDARVHILPRAETARLDALLRDSDLTIVHNVMTMPFNLPLTLALKNLPARNDGRRFIAWIHDLAACNPDYDVAEHRALLGEAQAGFEYIAVSEHRRREFRQLTGAEARVVPNGVDPVKFLGLTEPVAALAREHRILEHDVVLLSPARLLPRKNLELTIRTVSALKARGSDACAILTAPPDVHNAASAAYGDSLRTLTRDLGVEREIIFPDFQITQRDLASLYSVADALFFPSFHEGFGIPLLESGLHRLPIFCSDLPPLREIAPMRTEFFSPGADPAGIAAAIAARAANDAAWQNRKRVVREFSWDAIYTRHLAPLLTNRPPPL